MECEQGVRCVGVRKNFSQFTYSCICCIDDTVAPSETPPLVSVADVAEQALNESTVPSEAVSKSSAKDGQSSITEQSTVTEKINEPSAATTSCNA